MVYQFCENFSSENLNEKSRNIQTSQIFYLLSLSLGDKAVSQGYNLLSVSSSLLHLDRPSFAQHQHLHLRHDRDDDLQSKLSLILETGLQCVIPENIGRSGRPRLWNRMSRLQPRLKAVATSNVSPASASSTPRLVPKDPFLRPDTPISRQSSRLQSADPVSDRTTLFLIRRTLCSHLSDKGRNTPAPIDEILPPLTSSNEVDVQLYAFIAIIIREFVQTWYSKITPDPYFVEEVVKIIAHCTRALEQRVRKVDLESLLFDELPDLLETHVQSILYCLRISNYCLR